MQYLSAIVVLSLVSVSIGCVLGFSAILLPQMENEGLINAKSEEASWIGEEQTL
jgi:hypothetical protein